MKIIQSFYQVNKNLAYFGRKDNDNYLINYYSQLLSYIKLKEHFGSVTMYCNSKAYEDILKYIPYDEFVFDEIDYINHDNYRNEWGLLKFHVFEQQKEPFIHIDGDVFLFKNLLLEFINNKKYDGVVQSVESSCGVYGIFYRNNIDKLSLYEIISNKPDELTKKTLGNFAFNNGVVGFRDLNFLKKYIVMAKKINNLMNKGMFKEIHHQTMLFEQFCLYHAVNKYDMNFHEILPRDLILKYGYNETGNMMGYTHLLSGNKFVKEFVMMVRKKIFKDYPDYKKNIRNFEEQIINADIHYLKHQDIENLIVAR